MLCHGGRALYGSEGTVSRVVYERKPLRYQLEVLEKGNATFAGQWCSTGYAFSDLDKAIAEADSDQFANYSVRVVDTEQDDD